MIRIALQLGTYNLNLYVLTHSVLYDKQTKTWDTWSSHFSTALSQFVFYCCDKEYEQNMSWGKRVSMAYISQSQLIPAGSQVGTQSMEEAGTEEDRDHGGM